MHLLFTTCSSNEHSNGELDYAVVEMTPALLAEIRRRVELARQIQRQEDDLYELSFWGGTGEFYDHRLLEACEEAVEAAHPDTVGEWVTDFEQQGYAVLPAGVQLSQHEAQRTECDQIVLCCRPSLPEPTFELFWSASPKHMDITVTTHALSSAKLETL